MPMPRAVSIGRALLFSGAVVAAAAITYLLRDDFTTDLAAGAINGTDPEPGPGGPRVVVDTNGKLSHSGGKAIFATGGVGAGDPGEWWVSHVRAAGKSVFGTLTVTSGTLQIGWDSAQAGALFDRLQVSPTTVIVGLNGTAVNITLAALSSGVAYKLCVLLKATGAEYFIKGGAYSDWTRIMVQATGTTSPEYPGVVSQTGTTNVGTADAVYVLVVGSPFDTIYGASIYNIASPTDGATNTSEANAIHAFTWTPVALEVFEFDIRRTDDDNRWIGRCDQAGNTIKTIQREAGVETERASSAQTWATTTRTITVVAFGNTVCNTVADVAKNNYTSATFNNTATGTKVAGFATGANFTAWQRTLTGAALAALDAVYP